MMRFLLLSDIHWLAVANELDPDATMRNAFLRDVEDFCKKGAFDHILISGDIAFKGSRDEYEKAFNFLSLLCEKAKCDIEQIYVIPGNHDKNFKAEKCALRQAIHSGLSNDSSKTDELFNSLLDQDFDTVRTFTSLLKSITPLHRELIVQIDSWEGAWKTRKSARMIQTQTNCTENMN